MLVFFYKKKSVNLIAQLGVMKSRNIANKFRKWFKAKVKAKKPKVSGLQARTVKDSSSHRIRWCKTYYWK